MAKVCQLFSGSSGNSILVSSSGHNYLVDIGVSAKKCENGLNQIGIEPGSIEGIFVTHEHGDHAKASEFLQTDTKFRFMPPSFAMMNFTGKVLRMIKQILIL